MILGGGGVKRIEGLDLYTGYALKNIPHGPSALFCLLPKEASPTLISTSETLDLLSEATKTRKNPYICLRIQRETAVPLYFWKKRVLPDLSRAAPLSIAAFAVILPLGARNG